MLCDIALREHSTLQSSTPLFADGPGSVSLQMLALLLSYRSLMRGEGLTRHA